MMRLNTLATLSFVALTMVIGCSMGTAPEATAECTTSGQSGVAPPSELALMMRHMAAFADSTKKHLQRNEALLPFPTEFKQLNTAAPTDSSMKPLTFPIFGDDWLGKLDGLYAATEAERPKAFNALVQSCANCHGQTCPGPLVRIKKLYVPVK